MSSKKAQFAIHPAVYVRIDHEKGNDLYRRFLKWAIEEEIIGYRGGSMGPTGYVGWFYPGDADRIRRWLESQEASEYDWMTGEPK